MGEANRRGTFEERKQRAIIKNEEIRQFKIKRQRERRANMTEAERKREQDFYMMTASYMGLLGDYLPFIKRF